MKPEGSRVWRKARRAATKGIQAGRRATHRALANPPRRTSSWLRRHPGELDYWLENAR